MIAELLFKNISHILRLHDLTRFCVTVLALIISVIIGSACHDSDLVIEYRPPQPSVASLNKTIQSVIVILNNKESLSELSRLAREGALDSARVDISMISYQELNLVMKELEKLHKVDSLSLRFSFDWKGQDLDKTLKTLSILENIVSVDLITTKQSHLTDQGLESLGKMTQLEYLSLPLKTKATTEGFKHLSNLKHLKSLLIADKNFTDASLGYLKDLPLMKLVLADIPLTDAIFDDLMYLKDLESLSLYGLNITGKGLGKLSSLKHLDVITLARNLITDQGIWELYEVNQVEQLEFTICKFGPETAGLLSRFDHLVRLRLRNCSLSNEECEEITKSLSETTEVVCGD